MTRSVLVDTSFLVALLNARDVHHQRAAEIHRELEESGVYLIIPDVVVNESLAVLQRRLEERGDREFFSSLAQKIVKLWERDRVFFYIYVFSNWEDIIDLMLNSDGRLNFHDALLIIGARKKGLEEILSFDTDFDEYLQRIE